MDVLPLFYIKHQLNNNKPKLKTEQLQQHKRIEKGLSSILQANIKINIIIFFTLHMEAIQIHKTYNTKRKMVYHTLF